jgi:hypothetical protein
MDLNVLLQDGLKKYFLPLNEISVYVSAVLAVVRTTAHNKSCSERKSIWQARDAKKIPARRSLAFRL